MAEAAAPRICSGHQSGPEAEGGLWALCLGRRLHPHAALSFPGSVSWGRGGGGARAGQSWPKGGSRRPEFLT